MIAVRLAQARYRSEQPGITTWHSFAAGAHYDPANLSFGPVIGCDEHVVQPGAGFDWHAHRDVHIVSWVLAGTLLHETPTGDPVLVEPGSLLVQSTGDGIRHRETNPSGSHPLRLLQVTLTGAGGPPQTRLVRPPTAVGDARLDVRPNPARGRSFSVVVRGSFRSSAGSVAGPGSDLRCDGEAPGEAYPGAGEVLVVEFD